MIKRGGGRLVMETAPSVPIRETLKEEPIVNVLKANKKKREN
jgi:hypothetical protein